MSNIIRTILGLVATLALSNLALSNLGPLQAADWPQYRRDAARSAYTPETLTASLKLQWVHRSSDSPSRAWPRSKRLTYDRCFQPVVADGRLFFGSSVDGRLHALDAKTGGALWAAWTDGPIRFAPVCHKGKVFVASDDGHLYCRDAATGELIWKKRGGRSDAKILGNGRMISHWPLRGGPVMRDDILYFAAGIWPSDGVTIYAVDPKDGRELWVNRDSGSIYMPQPHGGANAVSGVSAQGYLAIARDRLLVPTGRAVPASFSLATGKFQYFHLQKFGQLGGGDVCAAENGFIQSGVAFLVDSGEKLSSFRRGGVFAWTGKTLVRFRAGEIEESHWKEVEVPDRLGKPRTTRQLEIDQRIASASKTSAISLAATPEALVLGFEQSVQMLNRRDGASLWTHATEGAPSGLAIADGRLYVSTDQGVLYCFGEGVIPKKPVTEAPTPPPSASPEIARIARSMLERSGIRRGYCLDIGCGDGSLSTEILRNSELQLIAVESDPDLAATARIRLQQAGFLGTRASVFHLPDLSTLSKDGLPPYFANLVISQRSALDNMPVSPDAIRHVLRPYGGVAVIGPEASASTSTSISTSSSVEIRGPLEGAGEWTHQYAEPGNSICSDDELISRKLETLWFRDHQQKVVQRHGRGPAPLFREGRLFSQGLDSLIAVDAYNGSLIWRHELPGILAAYEGDHLMGTAGSGSNFCVAAEGVYVRRDGKCLRIDAASGKLLAEFHAPKPELGGKAIWGYIACLNGILYGSLANPEHVVTYRFVKGGDMSGQLTESRSIFALDARSGKFLWRYDAKHSIRHNAIAIAAGKLFLIDRPLAFFDRSRSKPSSKHPDGELVALDALTGKETWRSYDKIYGTTLAASAKHQTLLMSYQPTRFKLASERGGRLTAFDIEKGKERWTLDGLKYSTRPILRDRSILTQGGAWDLLSGKETAFAFRRSYGCGQLAASSKMLVYRSGTLGYFDLEENSKGRDFGGMRPGCWINAIPAGGLVLVPDGSAGCVCSYLNRTWLALRPEHPRSSEDGKISK